MKVKVIEDISLTAFNRKIADLLSLGYVPMASAIFIVSGKYFNDCRYIITMIKEL